ncbi:acyltransferase family protein [Chryseobacterium sp.]|uniref:acyltransferase family protein n=1 Tax=Chryseobacterium sp. TaxID=1871047 RepID=UPI0011CAF992|nr:acyltransferase [Chryseobacterium sp.]TXF76162.1 acyltransferase [Chryseobacterium sp.]
MKYLKGLDTLRALAAFIVVFDHLELIKQSNKLYNLVDHPTVIYPDGHLSVMLFFVISGFLITYLLLVEKEKYGTVSIKNFYIRRILRIWPLYYMVLFLSYVIFQPDYSLLRIILPTLILPNIAYAFNEVWDVSPQIWSIGAEEQFYIFWPVIFLFIIKKKTVQYFLLLIIGLTILPYFLKFVNLIFINSNEVYNVITRFFYGTKFNSLIMGALSGFIYFKNRYRTGFQKYNWLKIAITFLPFVLWFFQFRLNHLNDDFYSLLFSFSVFQIVGNSKIKIDNPVTKFLGRISYGIYLYHWIIIVFLVKYIPRTDNVALYNLILYFSAISITVIISWLSFVTYERYFLNMKKKYEMHKP